MKSPYIRELEPNQVITGLFLVQHKDVRQKKSGEPYLSMMLADRTGELDAKMWDNAAEALDAFERDDFVRVKGLYQIFQNRPQLTVHKIAAVADSEVDFADYFPASARDRDEMFAELRTWIESIANPHLRALLETIFADDEIALAYRTAPAAKSVHHAWLGGLIEHVLSLCHLAKFTAAHYKDIDVDLLLAGVILHDIGKIRELSYARGFSYSTEGQLLGHIVIGMQMIHEKLRQVPDFPAPLRDLLIHMILSHHGEMEFGSPKVPMFAEAMLLHHLDNLDSKMECVRGLIERDRLVEGVWTGYSSALDRTLLKKRRYLEPGSPKPVEPAQTKPPQAKPATEPPSSSPFAAKLQTALTRDK
ncbi:MAG TPA: HD domain-containing protein [Bryobacteraceae bacterium]|nr:HD domain-containing protein [Bryobacteraceae bacterium]